MTIQKPKKEKEGGKRRRKDVRKKKREERREKYLDSQRDGDIISFINEILPRIRVNRGKGSGKI